jgi:hypothetical protein
VRQSEARTVGVPFGSEPQGRRQPLKLLPKIHLTRGDSGDGATTAQRCRRWFRERRRRWLGLNRAGKLKLEL